MSRNPLVNALSAAAYILLISAVMQGVSQILANKPDTFFAPVVFLSLLTLSASVMAYIFFSQPIRMLIEGKKRESILLMTKTIGIFGIITTVSLVLLLVGLA